MKELFDVTGRLFDYLQKVVASGEVHEDLKKENVTLIFKHGQMEHVDNYRLVTFASIPGKAMGQIILETMSKDESQDGNWEESK